MSGFFSKLPQNEQAALPSQPIWEPAASDLGSHLRHHESDLMDIPGVEGFATAADHVRVYVSSEGTVSRLPASLDGTEIRPIVTGEIHAQSSD